MKRIKVRNYRVITLSLLLGLSLVGLSLMLARPPVVKAATITVTNTNDSGAGSLRQAIIDAASGDTISFKISLSGNNCTGGACTIMLTSGELLINKNLTISGPGASLLTVQRSGVNGNFRIFDIASGNFNVTISGVSILNGFGPGNGGGILNSIGSTLTVTGCIIFNNTSFTNGGGLANGGTLTITNSTISNNTAYIGGGIYNFNGGTVTITNSTISRNGNGTNFGGGIYNLDGGTVNVTNSTISGNGSNLNLGGVGGGILNEQGTVNLTSSTVSGNLANNTGGIDNHGTVNVRNTIIAGNRATVNGPDFTGTLTSQGYNLIGNTSGASIIGSTTATFALTANPAGTHSSLESRS